METRVTITIETITPEMAALYLSKNNINRPLNAAWVGYLAYQMKENRWRVNSANPITFADDGTLLDGQHRLNAIIKAGVPVTMTIIRGANKDDFPVIDTGRRRGGSDVLALVKCPNHTNVAAIINYYLTIKKGLMLTSDSGATRGLINSRISNEDILNEYESSPDLYQTLVNICQREYRKYRLYSVPQFGGVAAYLIKEKHYDLSKVEEFFIELNDGVQYPYLCYLRAKILRSIIRTSDKDKVSGQAKMVMLSKAWNYFVGGEDRKQIPYRVGDKIRFD